MNFRLTNCLAAALLSFGTCGTAYANSPIALWTSPNAYSPGTVNGVPFFVTQEWGIVFTAPDDKSTLTSATFGFQLREYVYVPGDASQTLQLALFAWSPSQPQGGAIYESAQLRASDLWGDADAWGNRKGSFAFDVSVIPGAQYLLKFQGTGFVLFDTGASSGQLVLNQNNGGWANFGLSVNSDIKFGDTTPIPEPQTYALMLAGLGLVAGITRRRSKQQ